MTTAHGPKSYALFVIGKDATPADVVVELKTLIMKTGTAPSVFFHGWDEDPRELFEIPEVQTWCRAFVELGGLSLVNTGTPHPPEPFSSQMLIMACSGLPGAEHKGNNKFLFTPALIKQTEKHYRHNGVTP